MKSPKLFSISPEAKGNAATNREWQTRRGSASERGYGYRWTKARKTFLSRKPLCLGCEAVGRVEAATVVDHVIPHNGNSDIFWDTSMWQSCCKWHHDEVKQTLEKAYLKGKITKADLWLNSHIAINITNGFVDV